MVNRAEELIACLEAEIVTSTACPKCASDDLVTRHIPRGSMINHSSRQKVENEFVYANEYDYFWQLKAAKEHLTKHCRNCQYGWRENVVKPGVKP